MLSIKKIKFFFIIVLCLQLFYVYNNRSNFSYDVFKNSFSKNKTEIYALSPEVIESKYFLTELNINTFNLSDNIKGNVYLYQRLIEFNYPKRFDKKSKFYFFLVEENNYLNCKLLKAGKYLKIGKC